MVGCCPIRLALPRPAARLCPDMPSHSFPDARTLTPYPATRHPPPPPRRALGSVTVKLGPRVELGSLLPAKDDGWALVMAGQDWAVWERAGGGAQPQ